MKKPTSLAILVLLGLAAKAAVAQPEPLASIEVIPEHTLGEAYPFWTVTNFTSLQAFIRPETREAIPREHPFMREVNCIRLLGGRDDGMHDFFKGVDAEGRAICDFSLMLAMLDGILECGYTPRIVLDKVPFAMSREQKIERYGNALPPEDFGLYHDYVRQAVSAMIEAFGEREVRTWRFRVATEPDLYPNHWAGTEEEYWKLYDTVVDAVTGLLPEADIGPGNILNPTSFRTIERPLWGLDLIDHAAAGRNRWTAATGSRMTFFSLSWYDRVGERGDVHELSRAIGMIRKRLQQYPEFRDIPVEVAEFMILHDEHRNRLYAGEVSEWSASWLGAVIGQVYRENIRKVHLWDTTTAGVYHPQAHVLAFLEEASGGTRVETVVKSHYRLEGEVGAVAILRQGSLYLLVHHHDARRQADQTAPLYLSIRKPFDSPTGGWRADHRQVDAEHGVFIRQFIEDCQAAGIPMVEGAGRFEGSPFRLFGEEGEALFRQNRDRYAELSNRLMVEVGQPVSEANDRLVLELELPAHSVRMIRMYPAR